MPDGYETRTGFNRLDGADGLADADGDGRRNFEEFLGGTDPQTPDGAPLRLAGSLLSDGRMRLAWTGAAGVRLQRNSGLDAAGWEDVPGTDGVSVFEVTASGNAAGFFRLHAR